MCNSTRWWQLKYFWNFHPETWGRISPILTCAYFSNGLVKNHQLVLKNRGNPPKSWILIVFFHVFPLYPRYLHNLQLTFETFTFSSPQDKSHRCCQIPGGRKLGNMGTESEVQWEWMDDFDIYIYNMHMKITNAWNTFLKPLFLKQTKFFWAWTLFWDHLLRVLKVFRRSPLPPVKNVSLFWWPLKIISRGGAPIKTILAPA